jgi:hypothetical protein
MLMHEFPAQNPVETELARPSVRGTAKFPVSITFQEIVSISVFPHQMAAEPVKSPNVPRY